MRAPTRAADFRGYSADLFLQSIRHRLQHLLSQSVVGGRQSVCRLLRDAVKSSRHGTTQTFQLSGIDFGHAWSLSHADLTLLELARDTLAGRELLHHSLTLLNYE